MSQDKSEITETPLTRLLKQLEYEIRWEGDEPELKCVVCDARETWEAQGATAAAALEAAVSLMVPSRAGRLLLDRALATLPRDSAPRVFEAEDHGNVVRDTRAILADLQTVSARVDAGIPEAALMAPPLQKLHVLAWISRARALEHESNRNRAASDATGAIARKLTTLCKTWWPGSVRALQLDATPERAAREQGLPPATKWLEVAEAAEARLESLIAEPPSDDGWRDTAHCAPPPDEPAREIAHATRIIERLVGSLETPPTNDLPRPFTSNDELQLEDAAVRLRWARQVAPDPERWGAAIGRLRWLVAHKRGGQRLPRLLDPNHVPRPSWGVEAGSARSRLVALAPPPDGQPELLVWLTSVFDAFDGPSLATRLRDTRTVSGQPVAPLVMQITENDLPRNDRRLRRRLRQLHQLLEGMGGRVGDAGAAPATPPQESPAERDDAAMRPSQDELIFSRVRSKLPDVPALFVSNREDPLLRDRLTKALGWQLEWTTAEPRRISAIANSIGRGKYRVVLSATGFQDHSTDISLARAAMLSNTLYVRVNRGRVAACARALARELGIRVEDIGVSDEPEQAAS